MDQIAAPTDNNEGESAVERVYELVKAMAISFEFRPGERLNELELARKIGVSRTPLREALNRLAADRFLVFSPRQGFARKPLSIKEISDLCDFRAQLERGVARLAVGRASDAAIDELERSLADAGDPGAASRALELDEAFHARLAALTDNAEIVSGARSVNDRLHFVRLIDVEDRGAEILVAHHAIAQALRNRDAERVERLVGEHVTLDHERIVRMVKGAFARIYMSTPQGAGA